MERVILHSDLNNFYASVECVKNPSLKNKYVAVCGNREDRHGIVLAKNMAAKEKGVKTGDTIYEAQYKCPDLIFVPPDFESYVYYSRLVRNIYYKYTDKIEPFGMDECWLDVTGSKNLFGDGEKIAQLIRCEVKEKTGLTVSIGVSFNKIFSKLGSDMKKPDAVTVIKKEKFKEIVWPLDVGELLNVGPATKKKLNFKGIKTIGDLARCDVLFLRKWLGKNGETLFKYANGLENSSVKDFGYTYPIKSVGHGITLTKNLVNNKEVKRVILELSEDISKKLRKLGMSAFGVQLSVKDKTLFKRDFSVSFPDAIRSSRAISEKAYEMFLSKYNWKEEVREISVRAINLSSDSMYQISMFSECSKEDRLEKIECSMEDIKEMFGDNAVFYCGTMLNYKMPNMSKADITLPSFRK